MNNPKVGHFPPAKRNGLIMHGFILTALMLLSMWGFSNLAGETAGPLFVTHLLVGVVSFAPIPFFGYRAYALQRADYYIDRNSLAMLWGLRIEDIPLTDIEWVRPATDLTNPLSLPRFRIPGAVLGTRRHVDLGAVEFIASDASNLILIATSRRVFAISPEDPAALVQTFARATELGSLSPAESVSVYPSFIISQAWEDRPVRFLWTSGLIINIGMMIGVGSLIPSRSVIPFGFDSFGLPNATAASTQLILLPLLSMLSFIVGLTAGLYFFRWEKQQPIAYMIWISSTISSLLFLLAALFLATISI